MTLNKTLLIITAAAFSFQASANNWHYEQNYKVTITNITKGISFTPLLGATHKRHLSFFNIGESASQNIINIAEGGDISGLNEELSGSNYVYDTSASAGLLGPGMSVELELTSSGNYRKISIVAMALPTNDTLVALRGKPLPRRHKTVTYYMKAYDGGSEMNDEFCASIPGPHCGGSPFSPEDEGEGYIYPSPGIHGEGDLSRAAYDWQGPVAKVVIKRMW